MNNVFGDSVRFIPKGKPTDKNNKYVFRQLITKQSLIKFS